MILVKGRCQDGLFYAGFDDFLTGWRYGIFMFYFMRLLL